MKIKKEFEIKILDSSLDVYRLGNTKDLLHITDAKYKEKGKYVELNLKYPKNNISLLRSKSLNTDKITLASKGYKPSSNYFYMSLDKENSVVTLRKINTFYLFQNKFDYLETKVDKQKEGIQFRKIESREEIEHRKSNINYKIKTLENEDFKSLKYVDTSNDIIDQLSSLQIDDNIAKIPPLIGSISKKIMNSLKKAVVVNIKDLELLYKDKDVIRSVISKNAFYFNGRYILNDSFYSDDLQQTRKKILEIIHKKGYILTTDIKQDLHLIYELCNKDNTSPKYYLKGYYEEEDIIIVNKAVAADSIIYNIIKERYFCTLADIANNCSLEIERIKNVLFKEAFISVGENIYTIADPDDPYNELKQEIIRLVQNKKSYRKGEMNVAISNISEALSIETDVVLKHIEKILLLISNKSIYAESQFRCISVKNILHLQMDEFDTKYGIFVRMLMINVCKSKLTKKMDIREELQIDNQTMNKLIEFTEEKVTLLGFELVGIDKNQIVDPLNADKYYLIRNGNIKDSTKNKDSVLLRRMAAVFNLIIIESGRISLKRLVFLCSKIDIFSKYDIEGFIRFIKKEGYLEIIKEENECYVVLGWRFNVEYDAEDMINSLQTNI